MFLSTLLECILFTCTVMAGLRCVTLQNQIVIKEIFNYNLFILNKRIDQSSLEIEEI